MGLSYPFALSVKLAYITGLIVAATAFSFGLRYREKVYGQVLTVVGIITWSTIGTLGLGTGT